MGNEAGEALLHINSFSLSPHVNISPTVLLMTSVLGKRRPAWGEVVASQAASTHRWTDQATAVGRTYGDQTECKAEYV